MRTSRVILFGPFAAHLNSGELRRQGHKIRLQTQPFELLIMLLERPGEVVSRDEIRDKLWSADTFVDFDHSLGTAISKIRAALNDSAEAPRFVETLPKRGYRFIGVISPPPPLAIPVEPEPVTPSRPKWAIAAGLLAVLVCTLGIVFAFRWSDHRSNHRHAALTAAPFTALPGDETSPAFSPDGSHIAFAWNGDSTGGTKGYDLYVKAIGSETLLRLTHHPSEWISTAWSPDGTGGTPKLITSFSNFPVGFAWSADDRALVLSLASDTGFELDEVSLADGSKRRLDFAVEAAWPAVAAKADKLAYSTFNGRTNIWRKDLLHPQSPAVELITSTRTQDDAQYSPDGKRIAFESTRAGSQDIWMSDADGSNLVQISKSIRNAGIPRWSPDGKKIAFDSRRLEIYVADVSEQHARKLVSNVPKMTTPSWSRDGKWIYFRSYEALGQKIYRCPAAGGEAVALGGQPDGTYPQESIDGSVLYFAKRNANTGLGMLSPQGAFLESGVEGLPPIIQENLWTMTRGGVYFVPADSPKSLRYFDFATKKIRDVFEIDKDFGDGLSVSPDGRWLLYSQVDDENSDIMVVDRFS
jgi:Tol biopolymer transport system component/DNA-binding winged helix-turn-helix (wHTH) protein